MEYRAKSKIIVFLLLLIIILLGSFKNESSSFEYHSNNALNSLYIEDTTNEVSLFIDNNYELFEFYANTFAISMEDIEENLILINKDKEFNKNDIEGIGKEYESLDTNIIDYLFNLEDKKPNLFNKIIKANKESKGYIYNLIKYYSNIYDIDYKLLSSIAYIESGNLKAKGMMNKNNIYGGMGNNGLIGYRNINYGVLSYVKLMKEKYYNKGLTTVEKICMRYNPIEENGKKQINTKWVNNVNFVLSRFDKLIGIYEI